MKKKTYGKELKIILTLFSDDFFQILIISQSQTLNTHLNKETMLKHNHKSLNTLNY